MYIIGGIKICQDAQRQFMVIAQQVGGQTAQCVEAVIEITSIIPHILHHILRHILH